MKGKLIRYIAIMSALVAVAGCARPSEVNAETGEVIYESGRIKSKSYDPPGEGNAFHVAELKRGNMVYLVFVSSQTGIQVVNYTLDSIELSYHQNPEPDPQLSLPKNSQVNTGVWR